MAKMRKRLRGTGPRTTKKTHPGPVARGPVPRKAPKKNAPPAPAVRGPVPRTHRSSRCTLSPLDLFSAFLLMSIDIQVLADLEPILQILCILDILLQTKKARGEK